MKALISAIGVIVLCVSFSFSADARKSKRIEALNSALSTSLPDYQVLKAMNNRRNVNFIEASNMVVTKILPDDTQGLEHQKWTVRLSDGRTMQAVYNLDMCERVPLKVGDVISMGGQFIWTRQGGLLHWLHGDPKGNRPDGYVELNGKFFCK